MSAEQSYESYEDVQKTIYQLIVSQLRFDSYDAIASEIEICRNLNNVYPSNQLYKIINFYQISVQFNQNVSHLFNLNKGQPPLEVLRHPKVHDDYNDNELITIHPSPLSAEVGIPNTLKQDRQNSFLSGGSKHVLEKTNVNKNLSQVHACLTTKDVGDDVSLDNIQHSPKLIISNSPNHDIENGAIMSCTMPSNSMHHLIVQSLNTAASTLSIENSCHTDFNQVEDDINPIKCKTVKIVSNLDSDSCNLLIESSTDSSNPNKKVFGSELDEKVEYNSDTIFFKKSYPSEKRPVGMYKSGYPQRMTVGIDVDNNNSCTVKKGNSNEVVDDFDKMNLHDNLLRGIYAYGFKRPSAIQSRAIVPCVNGFDVIAQAPSGAGKTATFAISMLQRIDFGLQETQGLVLAPTRELAQQTQKVIDTLGDYLEVDCYDCFGGTNFAVDIRQLKAYPHIVVGTPGRVKYMIERKHLRTEHIKMFVLDEADEMLNRGLKNQIYEIFRKMKDDKQVALFSATMSTKVREVTKKFMRNPIEILVKNDELTLEGIKQLSVNVEKEPIAKAVIPPEAVVTPCLYYQDVFSKMINNTKEINVLELIAYVEKEIPKEEHTKSMFISSLVTAVCRSCLQVDLDIKNNVMFPMLCFDRIKEYSPVLIHFLQCKKDKPEVELAALDAVQLLVCELQHPRDLAYSIFCALDDTEVITPDGFRYWNDNSTEQLGRGAIRAGLKEFFSELSVMSLIRNDRDNGSS